MEKKQSFYKLSIESRSPSTTPEKPEIKKPFNSHDRIKRW